MVSNLFLVTVAWFPMFPSFTRIILLNNDQLDSGRQPLTPMGLTSHHHLMKILSESPSPTLNNAYYPQQNCCSIRRISGSPCLLESLPYWPSCLDMIYSRSVWLFLTIPREAQACSSSSGWKVTQAWFIRSWISVGKSVLSQFSPQSTALGVLDQHIWISAFSSYQIVESTCVDCLSLTNYDSCHLFDKVLSWNVSCRALCRIHCGPCQGP